MARSSAPSSPDIARPPKQKRSSASKRRIAAVLSLAEYRNGYGSPGNTGKLRGVASWQQQGVCLRAPDLASRRPRLSESPQKV